MSSWQSKYKQTVLVALLKNREDLDILKAYGWYRIPADKAPPMVREERVKTLAFYQPGSFGTEGNQIVFYAEVKHISREKRKNLWPLTYTEANAEQEYYRLDIVDLLRLPQPIRVEKFKRLTFLPTTQKQLREAKEASELVSVEPEQARLMDLLEAYNVPARRSLVASDVAGEYKASLAIHCQKSTLSLSLAEQDNLSTEPLPAPNETSGLWIEVRLPRQKMSQSPEEALGALLDLVKRYGGPRWD